MGPHPWRFVKLLYVSFDGVLQPLAFSQVVRPIAALAKRGFDYHLLSCERPKDLADPEKVRHVREALGDVRWTSVEVEVAGSGRRAAESLGRTIATAHAIAHRENVDLVHARAHQGALVSRSVKATLGVPYLFDVRGTWVEERRDWFGRPAAYAAGKLVERSLFASASGFVTLTQLLANDLAAECGRDGRPLRVITTCADFDRFSLRPAGPRAVSDANGPGGDLKRRLVDRVVIGIVGALNSSYNVGATMGLARRILAASPRTHLLVLSQQTDAYGELLTREGLPADRWSVTAAPHHEMADWLRNIDWGFLLLHEVAAKRGSMPTKLAEFFASGVRPMAYGCNSEMMSWVRRTGSGLALDSLDDDALDDAARRVAAHAEHGSSADDHASLARAREIARPHFSNEAGVKSYEELLRAIEANGRSRRSRG